MASNFQATRSDQTGFNPKEFIFKYLRFLPLFILSLVLSLIIAFFYLRYTSPTFQSRGSLVLTEDKSAANTNDKFAQIFVDDRSKNINNELEFLKSKALMGRVVDTLGLNVQYYAKGKIKQLNVYRDAPFRLQILGLKDSTQSFEMVFNFQNNGSFLLGSNKTVHHVNEEFTVHGSRFRVVPIGTPSAGSQYSVRYLPTRRVVGNLLTGLTAINKAGSSGMIILTMEADNAKMAADIVNELMDQYRLSTVEDKNAKTQKTLDFLNGRLAIVGREVDSITRLVNEYQRANGITDAEAQSSNYITRSAATEDAIRDIERQLSILDIVDQDLRNGAKIYEQVPFSLDIADATLQQQITSFNSLQAERKKLIYEENVKEGNPIAEQLAVQIANGRRNILQSIGNVRRAFSGQVSKLRGVNSGIKGDMNALPAKMQGLEELKQGMATKSDLYKFLNEKKEETAISLAATISNTRVLEQAEVSKAPVRPTSGKVRGIALIIGLMIPLLFVLV
ncbi:MAG: hypothetical protein EOP50_07555, partial [Sphingobacteriales bacterium]